MTAPRPPNGNRENLKEAALSVFVPDACTKQWYRNRGTKNNSCERFLTIPCIRWKHRKRADPCLPGASRLPVWDTVRFLNIIGDAFSYQPSAVKLFTSSKKCVISPATLASRDPGSIKNSSNIELVCGVEKPEKLVWRHQKNNRIRLRIYPKIFLWKVGFCNMLRAKTWN